MKNIHILPTDKLSKRYVLGKCIKELSDVKVGQFTKTYHLMYSEEYFQAHNIYITSNEEIIKGDWCFLQKDGKKYVYKCTEKPQNPKHWGLKIILTTDQDLIKDGVQAIDDEFLEWFVKNPNCEEVKIKQEKYILQHLFKPQEYRFRYKIIIPKEELKQEIILSEEDAKIFIDAMIKAPEPNEKLKQAFKNFHKQETLEEAANKDFRKNVSKPYCCEISQNDVEESFIRGAKWQQERSYSEEDMHKLMNEYQDYLFKTNDPVKTFKEWFEQSKKK